MNLKCNYCSYEWESRTDEPKVCPRCKNRLDKAPKRIVGLQIGGTIGPDDKVGVYVPMPTRPGVGAMINISEINPDNEVEEILKSVPSTDTRAAKIQKVAEEILTEKNEQRKKEKIGFLVTLAQGITTIAHNLAVLSQYIRL